MECADADEYDRIYCNALTVINKIVFTSPEAMVEFSGEKNITSALVKTFANIYSLKGQFSFELQVNKNLRLPITQPRYAKNEIKSLSIQALSLL